MDSHTSAGITSNAMAKTYTTPHRRFFQFIYDRLVNVHGEEEGTDYMRSLKERIEDLFPEEEPKPVKPEPIKTTYTSFVGHEQVCAFLDRIASRGWDLNKEFIKITEDRGAYFTVYYDKKLNGYNHS